MGTVWGGGGAAICIPVPQSSACWRWGRAGVRGDVVQGGGAPYRAPPSWDGGGLNHPIPLSSAFCPPRTVLRLRGTAGSCGL